MGILETIGALNIPQAVEGVMEEQRKSAAVGRATKKVVGYLPLLLGGVFLFFLLRNK